MDRSLLDQYSEMYHLTEAVNHLLQFEDAEEEGSLPEGYRIQDVFDHSLRLLHTSFYPDMLRETAIAIDGLVKRGVRPSQIAVIVPYINDSLRFTLGGMLRRLQYTVSCKSPVAINHI